MSLDVYLQMPSAPSPAPAIYVREDGQTKSITRAEWDARYPGREPVVVAAVDDDDGTVYHANITHNLARMAQAAGIYEALWRPEEINVTHARDLAPLLRDGLAWMQSEPGQFERFNPDNGWGNYEGLVRFVAEYLAACERYPDATVYASR